MEITFTLNREQTAEAIKQFVARKHLIGNTDNYEIQDCVIRVFEDKIISELTLLPVEQRAKYVPEDDEDDDEDKDYTRVSMPKKKPIKKEFN